jgi:hypothetical protein
MTGRFNSEFGIKRKNTRLDSPEICGIFPIMFEKIKVQLPAAEEKVAHLRRFL